MLLLGALFIIGVWCHGVNNRLREMNRTLDSIKRTIAFKELKDVSSED